MAQSIQRVARGLAELMNIFGGRAPQMLLDELRGVIEATQFYGLAQVQSPTAANAALTEGSAVTITVPDNQSWLLYGMHAVIVKTGTMTALRGSLNIGLAGAQFAVSVKGEECGPFGATETGLITIAYDCPYPKVLPPRSILQFSLQILGTDANANCGITASVGVLG
jgi:hypothetical protein